MLYLTGSRFNVLGRGTLSVSPSEASVSAAANVCDADGGNPLLFGTATSGYVKVDANALTNPGAETSTLSGWTSADSGTGASTETTTTGEFRSGTKAMKLAAGGAGAAARYQDIAVQAGEYRTASAYIKTSTSGTATITIQNRTTGLYWNGSTWAGSGSTTQAATGSFVQVSTTYRVETFDVTGTDAMNIRWTISCDNGTIFVDDCLDVPGVSFASIHGHNLTGAVTVESSPDDSSWTTRATMTRKRPAFWTSFSIQYVRYWKIAFAAPQLVAPYIGEAVLGQYQTSATPVLVGPVTDFALATVGGSNGLGRTSVYRLSTDARESVRLEFSADTISAADEIIKGIYVRSGSGQYPVVVVPSADESAVYFGRITAPMQQRRPFLNIYDVGFDLIGDPFPTVGA